MGFLPDERSRANLLYRFVLDSEALDETGAGISYEEVFTLLEVEDPGELQRSSILSGVVSEVNKRLHRCGDHRHLVNVARWGYRVGSPAELRSEVLSRARSVERQLITALRTTEKVVRHPDSTAGERKRAADAAASQAALLSHYSAETRRIRVEWPEEESSPVEADEGAA